MRGKLSTFERAYGGDIKIGEDHELIPEQVTSLSPLSHGIRKSRELVKEPASNQRLP